VKIDLVSEHASPLATLGGVDAGGQNVHVAALAVALARLGDCVTVHTRRDDPSLPGVVRFAPGVEVVHVDAGPPEPVPKDELLPHMAAFAGRLGEWWSGHRPDVVHSHFWMSGLAALDAARPLGIPVAHTFHALGAVKRRQQGSADTSPPDRLEIERRLAREMDALVATTSDETFELVQQGALAERITVVPCGVDLDRFRPAGTHGPADGAGPGDDPPPRRQRHRVVIVSRLVERKGIGNVITAMRALPDTELLIAGGPPRHLVDHDPGVAHFRQVAADAGVADRVHLLGAVSRDAVPNLLRSADVVACCPWYEPFGLVAVEAMACGVPVVASAVGGLAETVVDGSTGLHVPPRNPAAISTALGRLLGDDDFRARAGRAATQRAHQYGWNRIATNTHAVLRELVDSCAMAAARGAESA